ncbi:hypothetical protein SISSUDRAFT_379159 [Sistotremastrum suecicum HHB10207 ss-3]|uniref:Uncharacterized protein n=1 Tax=Sistotremastrum suecicum HHB10207 ss-3 TaxID=1314776 RepID=A0A165Z0C8_9AGAM|nr:hypothetical protein SISSUDRAFT_379159 [Sistotremastrum suecicum HHB10207 ss-3]
MIISHSRAEVLRYLPEFFSSDHDWSNVDPDGASSALVIAAGYPPRFPPDLEHDLSPVIAHITSHPSSLHWRKASEASIAYLVQCDISTLSDHSGVYQFLCRCVDWEFRDEFGDLYPTSSLTRNAAQTLLDEYQALFVPLPASPQSTATYIADETHNSDNGHFASDLSPNVKPLNDRVSSPVQLDTHITLPVDFSVPTARHEVIDMSTPLEPLSSSRSVG